MMEWKVSVSLLKSGHLVLLKRVICLEGKLCNEIVKVG